MEFKKMDAHPGITGTLHYVASGGVPRCGTALCWNRSAYLTDEKSAALRAKAGAACTYYPSGRERLSKNKQKIGIVLYRKEEYNRKITVKTAAKNHPESLK